MVLQVEVEQQPTNAGLACWCVWPTEVIRPLQLNERCMIGQGGQDVDGAIGDAVQWLPSGIPRALRGTGGRIRIRLYCDHVPDEQRRAVDGDHLWPGVSPLTLPDGTVLQRRTGDGIEGGTFDSWVRLTEDG